MSAIPFVIDACSSLNLFATGRPVEIVRAAELRLVVLPEVVAEAQYLLGEPGEDGERVHIPIDWSQVFESSVATRFVFPEEGVPGLIEFAAQLTDNDARCAALAQQLGIGLLSDDAKVRRVFSLKCPTLSLLSIVSTVERAAKELGLGSAEIRDLFRQIRERARFEPSRKDPAFDWYRQHAERG